MARCFVAALMLAFVALTTALDNTDSIVDGIDSFIEEMEGGVQSQKRELLGYECSPPPVYPPPVSVSSPPPCGYSPPPPCSYSPPVSVSSPPPVCYYPPPKCYPTPVTVSSPPPKCYPTPVTVASPPYCYPTPVSITAPPPCKPKPVWCGWKKVYKKKKYYWVKKYCKGAQKCCKIPKKWKGYKGPKCKPSEPTKVKCMYKCPKWWH